MAAEMSVAERPFAYIAFWIQIDHDLTAFSAVG